MSLTPEERKLVLSGADQYAECVGGYRESEARFLNYIESLVAAGIAHERARCRRNLPGRSGELDCSGAASVPYLRD